MALERLAPRHVFEIFETLFLPVHRCSNHEAAVREAVGTWARDRGFRVSRDDTGNLLVSMPATAGMEDVPGLLLQGHLDMVCESDRDDGFDFKTMPIPVLLDGDWIATDGTTLGADNGLGASIALGLLADRDPDFMHGPVEVLLTVGEETGLDGAAGLDPDALGISSRVMVNVDSEELGTITIGSAGGGSTILHREGITATPAPPNARVLSVGISGLAGGHSGVDIHLPRANAIKLVSRLLSVLPDSGVLGISSWVGGTRHNAIPRSSVATVVVHSTRIDACMAAITRESEAIQRYYSRKGVDGAAIEPGLHVSVKEVGLHGVQVLPKDASLSIIALACALPHGPAMFSPFMPDLVETSSNLATVSVDAGGGSCRFETSTRSNEAAELEATRRGIVSLGRALGWEATVEPAYPGWSPEPASPFLAFMKEIYEQCLGNPVRVKAVHAGLECSIISGKLPALEGRILSIGPTIEHPHSPRERARATDVPVIYGLIKRLVSKLGSRPRWL